MKFDNESLKEVEIRAKGGYVEETSEEFERVEENFALFCKKNRRVYLPFGFVELGEKEDEDKFVFLDGVRSELIDMGLPKPIETSLQHEGDCLYQQCEWNFNEVDCLNDEDVEVVNVEPKRRGRKKKEQTETAVFRTRK